MTSVQEEKFVDIKGVIRSRKSKKAKRTTMYKTLHSKLKIEQLVHSKLKIEQLVHSKLKIEQLVHSKLKIEQLVHSKLKIEQYEPY